MKRADSGHELGEVEEGLRLAAAGMECPAESGRAAASQTGHRGVVPSYSQAMSQMGSPKLEVYDIPGCDALRSAGRGSHVSSPSPLHQLRASATRVKQPRPVAITGKL